MSTRTGMLGLALLVSTAFSPAVAVSCDNTGTVGDTEAVERIRSQRAQFNQAIAKKNIEAIRLVLAEDVTTITGTDSDLFNGREMQLALWQSEFENADRAIYVRSTECVQISPTFPIAMEYGTWRGERPAKQNFATGSYSAKWRRVEGTWLLESEIFMTEACGGDFCPADTGQE